MPLREDKNYLYIFSAYLVLTLSYLLTEYIINSHQFGVPLDDTWIHFRYAENFAKGYFFQYNIGDPTPGSTSPLWVIIMSIPFLFSSNLFIPFSLFLGSLFYLLICFEMYSLSRKLGFDKNYALIISFLTLICGRLVWSSLSGMEITLFSYLTVIAARMHLQELENERINIRTGIIVGLSVVTRPESYLFAGIYYLITLILLRKQLRQNLKSIIISFALFLLIVLPYPIFCYLTTGGFLPNTFKGQDAGLRLIPHFIYIRESIKLFFKDNIVILLLWFAGFFYFLYTLFRKKIEKKFLLINLWIFLLPLISSFVAPAWRQHGRYLIPLIPFININAIYIFEKISKYPKESNTRNPGAYFKISVIILFLASSVFCVVYARALGWNTENIYEQQVNIAGWLNKNLPDEKSFGINDIGAITFITKRRVVDMEGLVSPEILALKKMPTDEADKKMMKILRSNGVNFLIIYPEWYENLMKKYSEYFEKIYSIRLQYNTICGADEVVVYKIHWEKIKL